MHGRNAPVAAIQFRGNSWGKGRCFAKVMAECAHGWVISVVSAKIENSCAEIAPQRSYFLSFIKEWVR